VLLLCLLLLLLSELLVMVSVVLLSWHVASLWGLLLHLLLPLAPSEETYGVWMQLVVELQAYVLLQVQQ
jgi:hypothetical protein